MKEFASIIEMCLLKFHEYGDDALKIICNCKIPSDVMLMEYKRLGLKVEELPIEEKNKMWEDVYAMFPTNTPQQRTDICKIIHLIVKLMT